MPAIQFGPGVGVGKRNEKSIGFGLMTTGKRGAVEEVDVKSKKPEVRTGPANAAVILGSS